HQLNIPVHSRPRPRLFQQSRAQVDQGVASQLLHPSSEPIDIGSSATAELDDDTALRCDQPVDQLRAPVKESRPELVITARLRRVESLQALCGTACSRLS